MKRFALIGAAGFVAPRHMKAIKETGNSLVAALDKSDSVGILDSYFPECEFFTEFERFDRHLDKLRRKGDKVDYVSICSPNYLHDSHIRFALRQGADAICEKPLVLNPWNVDALHEIEKETGRQIYTILQLRLHPEIIALRERVLKSPQKNFDVDLNYITSRGKWYQISWKGDDQKSGGVSTNIGIHFFDMLIWLFGDVNSVKVDQASEKAISGSLELARARVRWLLSVDEQDLPHHVRSQGKRTHRSIRIDNKELEFSEGFGDLHTASYREILVGRGFGLAEARPSIQLVHDIRNAVR
jgi:UDP-N-acetyl-2-amino-2-deoxyglucuronate dehydrogenase